MIKNFKPSILGETGMICATGRKTTFGKLHHKCYACSVRIRVIDSPHGNLYVFVEVLISCMTVAVGYRTENDYAPLYEQATAGYTFNPDEIEPKVFTNHPDSKYPCWPDIYIGAPY